MMAAPKSYFDWVHCLEKFGQGDDAVIPDMEKGTFHIDAGTAQRFYIKVEEVYSARKKLWLDKYQRSFQLHNLKTENDFSIILQSAKINLHPIQKFIAIKCLPIDLQKTLKEDFENFVNEIRKSMKDNTMKSQPKNEKLLFMIQSFCFFENAEQLISMPDTESTVDSTTTAGRNIIF